ncbi:MAG: hypothetical protein A2848_02315 [Candidatus Magasanikbacteria bacterium RIFCSPHIGHO2_01_FULL_50_8]|uniref:Tetratricopeptide repeat-like domain-containing protein n=2 Tax=Candidatus Magasanikiibacteriota TaxID=1752731 RepID=A0A1F6LQQ8_9BACT|nr:MAG: hypothetical protein A2848_02315 [Candidatus Magasanikbacteria bacterium RIFCSPHIGHO2_01_FULL_50_8]OGH67726.1 MAG: hypothetical protein A3C15_04265 [Candidatus Magasanikbacteria bacterium RIFCSPHIGHO2_02_FULL_50_9b]
MQIPTKHVIIGSLVLIAAVIAAIVWLVTQPITVPTRSVLGDKTELLAQYDRAVEFEGKIIANPDDLTNYLVASAAWKFLGDFTKENVWYQLSEQTLARAIELTENKNTLVLGNAAQIAEALGDYRTEKKYYTIALDLTPGDTSLWLAYIKMLRFKIKVSESDVLRAFDDAMSRVVGGADLISARAEYLKSIGRFDDARTDLELLLKNKVITQEQLDSELRDMAQQKESK